MSSVEEIRQKAVQCRAAREKLQGVQGDLRKAVVAAVEAGVPQARAAREAGIARGTVINWLKEANRE